MTMTRTEIIGLADDLAHSVAEDITMTQSYDDILDRLARTTSPFVADEAFTPTDGTAEYDYPTNAVMLLGVFHNGKHLIPVSSGELEAYSASWRATAEQDPVVYTVFEEDARSIKLFPTPSDTDADGGLFLFAENRTTDIPEWLVLPIVFEILAEEFAYPSDHQDKEFAAACLTMSQFLKAFTGVG